ncbi:cupin domain-containing protein [Bradyrhizobium zhanjiangense]|uniref:cupin domain-containing protein n=1 Tax=Bradyrhizobium zhanjiangense TaxID=1325107 RepID=UPI0019D7147A|nr:cupin domain-containing protein [Bradyrhizobium zhanjiangense]
MKKSIVVATLILFAGPAMAQNAMKVVKPDGLTWTEHPVFKGVQTVILIGDPTKAETIVQRVKFPPNYKVAPHIHPYAEVVTVMSAASGMPWVKSSTHRKGAVEGGFRIRADSEASPLCLDDKRGDDRPNCVHRARGHRVH